MKRRGAKEGIAQEILLGTILFFIAIVLFFVFTPMLNGTFNFLLTFTQGINLPNLTAFLPSYMQGTFLVFSGGMVALVIMSIVYMIFAANRDEPSE